MRKERMISENEQLAIEIMKNIIVMSSIINIMGLEDFEWELFRDDLSQFGYSKYATTEELDQNVLIPWMMENLDIDDLYELRDFIYQSRELFFSYSTEELEKLHDWNRNYSANLPGKVRLRNRNKCRKAIKRYDEFVDC